MAYFKFKPTAAIVSYFPQLLKKEWWMGYQDPNTGNVSLMDDGKEPFPSVLQGLVIAGTDVEERKDRL
jgi:hypothetical protein